MQTNEEKIATFTQKGTRLQLIKVTKWDYIIPRDNEVLVDINTKEIVEPEPKTAYRGVSSIKYQVRLNRKIIDTSLSEYQMRKVFATYAQNIVLQLKVY